MGTHFELLKHRLEAIPSPPFFLPGYEEMIQNIEEWEEKNLTVFGSCLQTGHLLCEAMGGLDIDIDKMEQELLDEQLDPQSDDFCAKWAAAWEKATSSLVENAQRFGDSPVSQDQSLTDCLTSARRLQRSAATLPFPYVTKKDLDRMYEDVTTVRSFVERRMPGAGNDQTVAE